MSLFSGFKARRQARQRHEAAVMLYNQAVIQGRQPGFYHDWAVADTFDGRFDMIVLHVVLIFRRLKTIDGKLAQALYDVMTEDLEANLRTQGVGDDGLIHRHRKYTKGIYARLTHYSDGLDAGDDSALAESLRKSVYRPILDDDEAAFVIPGMVAYMIEQAKSLEDQDLTDGLVSFGPAPVKESSL